MQPPDSPYAPPRAAVGDRERELPPPERPARMTPVLVCVGLDYALGMLGALLVLVRMPGAGGIGLAVVAIFTFLIFGLMLLVNLKLAAGRNWARITYIVISGFSVLTTLLNLLRYARGGVDLPVLMPFLYVASIGLEAFVVWALFTAPVRAWFYAMKARG